MSKVLYILAFCGWSLLFSKSISAQKNLENLEPLILAEQNTVLRGDTFRAELRMAAIYRHIVFSDLTVNDQPVPIQNGKAQIKDYALSIGQQNLLIKGTILDTKTGKKKTFSYPYTYESTVRSVAMSAEKMNILYKGVENPFRVAVSDLSPTFVELIAEEDWMTINGKNGLYLITPSNTGQTTLMVRNKKNGKLLGAFEFRVKPIPDPIVSLARITDKPISKEELAAQKGLMARTVNFDFDARCSVTQFTLLHISGSTQKEIDAKGALFVGEVATAIRAAQSGDIYIFKNVKGKCQCDTEERDLNTVTAEIK